MESRNDAAMLILDMLNRDDISPDDTTSPGGIMLVIDMLKHDDILRVSAREAGKEVRDE
jgi:hypothetical protein